MGYADTNIEFSYPYKLIIESKGLCHNQDVFLVVYVHTSPDRIESRNTIRQTWGNSQLYDLSVRVVFIMGKPAPGNVMHGMEKILEMEAEKYQDIVQGDFVDDYRNLTYKSITSLRWIKQRCSHTEFVLKTDDSTFVNLPALLRHLWDLSQTKRGMNLLLCRVWWETGVLRSQSKWAVTKDQYPLEVYPPHCSQMAYVMSMDVVSSILIGLSRVPFFWVDDVFITGMVPYALGIEHVSFPRVYMKPEDAKCFGKSTWYKCLFVRLTDTETFTNTWELLKYAASRYPIPKTVYKRPGLIAGNNDTSAIEKRPDDLQKTNFDKFFKSTEHFKAIIGV